MTHEQSIHVYNALATFAGRYPGMCEMDRRFYRDMSRAALLALREQEWEAEVAVGPEVERVIHSALGTEPWCELGRAVLREARRAGLVVTWDGGELYAGPRARVTPPWQARLVRYREEIRHALAEEVLSGAAG